MNTALILAGGIGTRLRAVVNDLPKPLAPVNGKPFLHYILHTLVAQQIERCVLSVGYKAELIRETFGDVYAGMRVDYAVETEPLGTGGALRLAAEQIDDDFFLLNGDTLAELSLASLTQFHQQHQADISLSLAAVDDLSRYGSVIVNADGRVSGFAEKQVNGGSGLINAGVYAIAQRALFTMPPVGESFSLERIWKAIWRSWRCLAWRIPATLSISVFLRIISGCSWNLPGSFDTYLRERFIPT